MTLDQLRIFIAVAEREHVTRAAGELNLTQSAVSAAVATLEARYDVKLFDRVGRRIELTEVGRLFLAEARAVIARAHAADAMLSDVTGLKRGTLALAASQTVGNYWLPPRMQQFRRTYPGIDIRLAIGNTETVARMVRDGVADLGFVEGALKDTDLISAPIDEDELVLVVGAKLAPAKGHPLTPARLRELPWVIREAGSGTRALFETALLEAGIQVPELRIALEMPSNEAVRAAVESGSGAAVLSRHVVAASLASGRLVQLDFALPKRQFFMLHHTQRYLSQAAKAFRKIQR